MTSAFKFNFGRDNRINILPSSQYNSPTIASATASAGNPSIATQTKQSIIESKKFLFRNDVIRNYDSAPKPKSNSKFPLEVNKQNLITLYREKARYCSQMHRIFSINGCYPTLRRELTLRGWVEKLPPGSYPFLESLSDQMLLQHARNGNDYERVLVSRYLQKYPAYFVWRMPSAVIPEVQPYRNLVRFGGPTDFTSKTGLIGCAEQEQWYHQDGVCAMSYPRFYRLSDSFEERKAFIEDFRLTQCESLLRYVVEKLNEHKLMVDFEKGTIPFYILNFALNQVRNKLEAYEHRALDIGSDNVEKESLESKLEVDDWKDFIINSYQILNMKAYFKATPREMVDFVNKAQIVLNKLEKKFPTYRWDGYRNLWILKPAHMCRGNGIILRNKLDEILSFSAKHLMQNYIVQKYVERPFLIYRTKFDIRQYLLITIDKTKIYLWLYRDCYFKFSSVEFNLDDVSEQIHLTNNSVQKKYKNNINRDVRLPACNMWSLQQFKNFLREEHISEKIWEKRVFAGFKENLIAVLLAGMEDIEIIPNSFDLYGCDFMLDSQLYPILIEINSTPDMTPSTDVTARLCPRVLKDMIKVVIDVPNQSTTNTGGFELVYEINYAAKKGKIIQDTEIAVSGKAMKITPVIKTVSNKLFKMPVSQLLDKKRISTAKNTKQRKKSI